MTEGFIGLFAEIARAEQHRVFARFEGEALTFGALDAWSGHVAAGLRERGVKREDRVGVMLGNSPAAMALLLGIAKAGAVWIPLNVQLRAEQLRYILGHAEPSLVVTDATSAALVREVAPASTRVMDHMPEGGAFDEALPAPDALFAISYTSGTTGPPKGVLMTHRMLRLAGEGAVLASDARDGDVFYMWEPLYHIGGSQLMVVAMLRRVVLHMAARFSASRFWAEVRAAGATHIHYLGGILQILMKQPESPLDRGHAVRVAWGAGCPADLWRAIEARFGLVVRECYGMTEASSFTTVNANGVAGSVGTPVPWFRIALLDPAGQPAARGEIVVRSDDPLAITAGYFRNPEATGRALRDGALHTGDVGSFDAAGNLFFHGRMSDSVRVRGENVSAWEVERVAAMHPGVDDCAVLGVAAEVGEQEIKLFLKARAGAVLELPQVSAWLAERLPTYQSPRYLAVVEDFERTPSQRIMKHRLSTRVDDCWRRV